MKIFRAKLEDIPRMMQCAVDCCAEHGEQKLGGKFNPGHYQQCWNDLIGSGEGAMFLAEDDGGKIVAGIGGVVGVVMLTGRRRVGQLFWYVDPKHRPGLISIRLLDVFEKWAAEVAEFVTMPVNDGMSQNSDSFFTRRGYVLTEKTYRKEL